MVKFILITNEPDLASYAEDCGVSRIFVDLERLGKVERQGHLDTLISKHSMDDVAKVKAKLKNADLLVRLNPLHDNSRAEVDAAVQAGADTLILPMFRSAEEVEAFCQLVDGRVGVMPLVETLGAAQSIDQIVKIEGVTEVYVGLNDLHLDMGLRFMFEPLANGVVDEIVRSIKAVGLPFGFGGIARVGEGVLPGELVLGEHIRLGSGSVILSRTFHRKSENVSDIKASLNLKHELDKLIQAGDVLKLRPDQQVAADHQRLQAIVREFVKGKKQ